jgi:F-box protein 39
MAPNKRVFLEIQGLTKVPLMLQPHAPVRGVVFRTPYHRLRPEQTTWLVEYYGKTLEYVVQETLPRAHGSRKFHERVDESLLRLVRECPRLHTLVIRERLSLVTLLLLVQEAQGKLRQLLVRRNALIKKCEWPRAKGWSEEYYRWLRRHGKDYTLAFQQVPKLLGKRWKPTDDRIWKHMRIHIT